ncbi:MAG: hypothetical protein KGQ51_00825 [Planctomycetes bacterium]|nr:hypothetical protein [Planctomycetota bacterium]
MSRWIAVLAGLALLIGCGPKVEMNQGPVSVSGKLTASGAAVGDVLLTLQPLDTGHVVPISVGADGSFRGEVIPGKYAYYVTANEGKPGAIDKVPADFRQASMTRTVTVSAGQSTLDIALD